MNWRELSIIGLCLIACFTNACGTEPSDKTDAGIADAGADMVVADDLAGQLTVRQNGQFVPLEDGASIEIISGFQGGWHVEPYLRITGIVEDDLYGTTTFWVERDSIRIAETGQQQFEPLFFNNEGDAFLFFTQPVVFLGSYTPENLAGTDATIRVNFELDDGRTVNISTPVSLIDEVEEFDF